MKFLKRIAKYATTGLLIPCLIFGALGCNPTTAVNAIGAVANTFLSNCGTFTANPVDLAACTSINGIVQAGVTEFDAAYAAYTAPAGGTASNFARLEAAITAALKNLPAALEQFRITNANSQNKILGMIELIVSAFELVAGFFGVAPPAMSARMSMKVAMVKKGDYKGADKGAKQLKVLWNSTICGGLTGAQLASCTVN